jgi:hypothetical protein
MAIHLTPTELARESGMERREVIETLFLANVSEQSASRSTTAARVATA